MPALDCSRIGLLLEPYADGELPAGLAEGVEAHLAMCPDCAGRARGFLAPVRMLRDWPVPSGEDLAALAVQRAELVHAFAVSRRSETTGSAGTARQKAARQLLGRLAGVTGRQALHVLNLTSRTSARWALAGLVWLAPGAGDLLAGSVPRRQVAARAGRRRAARSGTFGTRVTRSALGVSAAAVRACAKAGRGAIALG